MLRAIGSAWVPLRRPGLLWPVLALAPAFAVIGTLLGLIGADDRGTGSGGGPGPSLPTLAQLGDPDGIVAGLGTAANLFGVLGVALGAWALAADFQHGTLRTLLVRQPDRVKLLGGKLVALWGLLALAGLAASAVGIGLALALAPGQGVDTTGWTVGAALTGTAGTVAAMCGYGLLGAVLGVLLRSSVAAVGAGVAWVFVGEGLLGSVWSGAQDVLPGQLLGGLVDASLDPAQVATLAAWVGLGAVVAARSFVASDIRA